MRNQRKLVTLLRWVMFLALASLMTAHGNTTALQLGLLAVVAGSNLGLARISPRRWESPALLPLVASIDIGVLTASMFWGQGFAQDFFFVYFLLLAVVAMASTLRLSIAATTVVVLAYGGYLGLHSGLALFQSAAMIGRLGFLFSVGVAYGGLTEAGKARLRDAAVQGQLVGWVGKLSSAFSDEFDAREVIRHVLVDLREVLPDSVRASLVQIDGETLQVISSSDNDAIDEHDLVPDRYPEIMHAIEHQSTVVIDDLRTSPLTATVRDRVNKLPFRSLLLCPVNLEDSNIGHVVLRLARHHGDFPPGLVATAENVAEAIGVVFRQAKLREAIERSEKMEMVSQITTSVAHSFNSILSTVLLSAESLRKEAQQHGFEAGCGATPYADASMGRFETIELAVKEGLTIVERLDSWTRQHGDSPASSFALLDPKALLEEAWRYAQPLWMRRESTRELTLCWQVEPTCAIVGNASELREVVLNLIINAIDAMPKGGTLTLSLDGDADTVRVGVRDTGIGIPEDHLDRVFEPLFSTKGSAGTGLGLSIARSVAQRHAGTLTASSQESIGSHFVLSLPANEATPELAGEAVSSESAEISSSGARVLLVEENELVRDVMLRFLQKTELEVDVVASTEEAHVMLSTLRRYRGMLVDAGLAAHDTAAFLQTLRANRPELEGRLVFYSTRPLTVELGELQRQYRFGFVNRSQGLEALHEALATMIAGSAGSSEQAA